jgi:hypothetical protein
MTSSPGESNLIIASIAPKPLPKQSPYLPFSRAARFFSKALRVGLPVLEYSYPLKSPGLAYLSDFNL